MLRHLSAKPKSLNLNILSSDQKIFFSLSVRQLFSFLQIEIIYFIFTFYDNLYNLFKQVTMKVNLKVSIFFPPSFFRTKKIVIFYFFIIQTCCPSVHNFCPSVCTFCPSVYTFCPSVFTFEKFLLYESQENVGWFILNI